MLKSALNIHNFSFKNHTSTAIIGTNGAGKINAYQHYSRH